MGSLTSLVEAAPPLGAETGTIPTEFMLGQVIVTGDPSDVQAVLSAVGNFTQANSFTLTLSMSDTQIALYEITASVTQTVININNQALLSGTNVVAEPNYFIAASGYHINGSAGIPPQLNAPNVFESQWIWNQQPGIGLTNSQQLATEGYTGNGIQVAVFDNSTFTEPISNNKYSKKIAGRDLFVWHLADPLTLYSDHEVEGHGYSVASLINHMAPDAQLHLFRVLNESGIGDLFTLNQAINTFITLYNGPGVINLSLGVLANPETITDIYSLRSVLLAADEKNFVTVAAAGNRSEIMNGTPVIGTTEFPARFPFVLSVAAHTANGDRSCFSSPTDGVSAPGGEGHGFPDNCGSPSNNSTIDLNQCVVALDPTSTSTGASCWIGTSFATPLVSGIAALVWQKGDAQVPGRVTPSQVICAIERGALNAADSYLGHGMANLPNSLNRIISAAPMGCQTSPIPTLSQWGLIVMALLLLTVGTIFIQRPPVMVSMGGGTMQLAPPSNTPLFVWPVFVKVLAVTLTLFAASFAIAIWGFGYIPDPADPGGSVISAIILAYMLHLRLVPRSQEQ